jgi:hypothetical protein
MARFERWRSGLGFFAKEGLTETTAFQDGGCMDAWMHTTD